MAASWSWQDEHFTWHTYAPEVCAVLETGFADSTCDEVGVWLQGGQPMSDGPGSTTFKFKFAKGEMPTGKKPGNTHAKPSKPAPSAEL